jgi:hypothetical protein
LGQRTILKQVIYSDFSGKTGDWLSVPKFMGTISLLVLFLIERLENEVLDVLVDFNFLYQQLNTFSSFDSSVLLSTELDGFWLSSLSINNYEKIFQI